MGEHQTSQGLKDPMNFIETKIPGAFTIEVERIIDERGSFFRSFCKDEFKEINHSGDFIQFNHSVNSEKGTIRGMHYQLAPHQEIKLISCIRGRVYDVLVDLRANSPTFLDWFGIELSSELANMIYVPKGVAHGFQTLESDSELLYHHTSKYQPEVEGGVRFDDEMLGIDWPSEAKNVSERDRSYPVLSSDFKGV